MELMHENVASLSRILGWLNDSRIWLQNLQKVCSYFTDSVYNSHFVMYHFPFRTYKSQDFPTAKSSPFATTAPKLPESSTSIHHCHVSTKPWCLVACVEAVINYLRAGSLNTHYTSPWENLPRCGFRALRSSMCFWRSCCLCSLRMEV